jgi:protein-tyrosine phosphatase
MDGKNLHDIERLRPSGSGTEVRLFLDYAEGRQGQDVPDPYYTRDFDGALDLIEFAAKGLLKSIGKA